MRVVLLGDVGHADQFHAGNEAMFDAAVERLGRISEVHLTAISQDPNVVTARYGLEAVGGFGFAPGPGARATGRRDQRMDEVLSPGGDPGIWGEPGLICGAVDALQEADALVITGGGNICSTWPELVFERVAALKLAQRSGIPAVLTGQTIGPVLDKRQISLLAEASPAISLLGLRERASMTMASTLVPGVPRRLQVDDAAYLPEAEVEPFEGIGRLDGGFVSVTVHPFQRHAERKDLLVGLARLVRDISLRTGLPVAFIPHVGRFDSESDGDLMIGRGIQEMVGTNDFVLCPLLPPRQLRSLTRRSKAVVSTRCHPIVFALSGAVPCLALYEDHYTETKLTGALEHGNLDGWRLPIDSLATDLATSGFSEMWRRRDEISTHLAAAGRDSVRAQDQHWTEIWEAISDPAKPIAARHPDRRAETAGPKPALREIGELNQMMTEHLRQTSLIEFRWVTAFVEAETYALDLEANLAEQSKELTALRAHLEAVDEDRQVASQALKEKWAEADDLAARLFESDKSRASAVAEANRVAEEADRAHVSASSARSLVADANRTIDDLNVVLESAHTALEAAHTALETARSERDALMKTKTFRWLRPFRQRYAALRRLFQLDS